MLANHVRKFKLPVLFLAAALIGACSSKVSTQVHKSYPPIGYDQKIEVIEIYQAMPSGAEILGEVKIGDSGFSTNCGYAIALEAAKSEARKIGGNAIKIYQHKMPDALGSTCHRIKAHILYIPIEQN